MSQTALNLLQFHSAAVDAKMQFVATDDGVEISYRNAGQQLSYCHSFVCGAIARRSRQPNQALIKACNNKQGNINTVLDLTGGWGIDGLILAYHGQQVTLLEYNRLVFAVVDYSLSRLAANRATRSLAKKLTLKQINALEYLQSLSDQHSIDCIYLDPMFPGHKSTAKPAKELQILQALTENSNIEPSFDCALKMARKRVVVKRPAKAPRLSCVLPDLVYREKTIRFDVYLTA